MKTQKSKLAWNTFVLATTEYFPDSHDCDVLIMHGAGEADQNRTKSLALALIELNCRVITFDFVGHGLSTGIVSDLTLANRAEQALDVYNHFGLGPKTTLIGFSMSGQTAIDLMYLLNGRVSCLALFAPAIYDKVARKTHFGPNFSELIRKDESWRYSDAWEKLKTFKGKLITFESPNDPVIPTTAIDLLHHSTLHAAQSLRVRVDSAPHTMALWTSQSYVRAQWFADAVLRSARGINKLNSKLARQADIQFEIL
jgi:pimeloyl-ACP methyl ester carboxylesterase